MSEWQETERDWSQAQDWKGMDGATAWLLIHRAADGWGDTRAMMEAWLAANAPAEPLYQIKEAFPEDPRGTWRDASAKAYDMHTPDRRRILYAALPPPPSPLDSHQEQK